LVLILRLLREQLKKSDPWVNLMPPRGWAGYCHLPARSEMCSEIDQDLGQFRSGGICIDVGWLNRFVCRVVKDTDWEIPLIQLETKNPVEVFSWILQQLDKDW
jgi:hypothetical protein